MRCNIKSFSSMVFSALIVLWNNGKTLDRGVQSASKKSISFFTGSRSVTSSVIGLGTPPKQLLTSSSSIKHFFVFDDIRSDVKMELIRSRCLTIHIAASYAYTHLVFGISGALQPSGWLFLVSAGKL